VLDPHGFSKRFAVLCGLLLRGGSILGREALVNRVIPKLTFCKSLSMDFYAVGRLFALWCCVSCFVVG
jgi:hypothetical protein